MKVYIVRHNSKAESGGVYEISKAFESYSDAQAYIENLDCPHCIQELEVKHSTAKRNCPRCGFDIIIPLLSNPCPREKNKKVHAVGCGLCHIRTTYHESPSQAYDDWNREYKK